MCVCVCVGAHILFSATRRLDMRGGKRAEERDAVCMGRTRAQRRETLYVWGGADLFSATIVTSTSLRLAIGTCEEETPLETVSSDQKLCRHQFQPRLVRSMKLKRRVLRSCTNLCSPLVELAGLSNLSKNNAGHNIICNLSNQNVKRTAQAVKK